MSDSFWLGRCIRYCPACRARRRFIAQLHRYFCTQWTCRGCGNCYTTTEGRERRSAKQRAAGRAWAREMWPKAWPYRQAVRAMWEPLERTEV